MLSIPITIITIFQAIIFLIAGFTILIRIYNQNPAIPILLLALLLAIAGAVSFAMVICYGDLSFLNNFK